MNRKTDHTPGPWEIKHETVPEDNYHGAWVLEIRALLDRIGGE